MGFTRIPVQVLVAAFPDPNGANLALESLTQAAAENPEEFPVCSNAVIASKKTADSKVKVQELGKPTFLKGLVGGTGLGAAAGAVIGGAALALLGPIGVGVGATAGAIIGAPIGGVNGAVLGTVGHMELKSMTKEQKEELSSALAPGSSALVLVLAEVVVKDKVLKESMEVKDLQETQNEALAAIREDVAANLKEGKTSLHLYAIDEEGVVAFKATAGDKQMDLAAFLLTNEGDVAAVAAQAETNKDGDTKVMVAGAAAGPDGISFEVDEAVFPAPAETTPTTVSYEVDEEGDISEAN